MACNRCNCHFSFWAIFCPPPLPPFHNSLKNGNFQKKRKHMEMSSFYTSAPKIMIIWYAVPEIWHVMYVIIFHFGLSFALLPPPPPLTCLKNENFKKMKKKHLEISSFYPIVPKIMIIWCTVPEIWCVVDQSSTNLIFACTDFRACKMALHARLCMQNNVWIKQ